MKRILILLFCSLLASHVVYAQRPGRERVAQLRKNFITKKLELTPAESDKFWPVYNEYHAKLRRMRRDLREAYLFRGETIDEQKAQELVRMELDTRQGEADLYRTYSERIREIIGVKRLARLHLAEEEFRRDVMEALRGNVE